MLYIKITMTTVATLTEVAHVYPAGKYYIGDICYALSSTVYELVWGDEHKYKPGTYSATYKGETNQFSVAYTAYGDGLYVDPRSERDYTVDSGSIGIVPFKLCSPKKIKDGVIKGGHFIESTTPVQFHSVAGIFVITYNDNRDMVILDTADLEDDSDDEDENGSGSVNGFFSCHECNDDSCHACHA